MRRLINVIKSFFLKLFGKEEISNSDINSRFLKNCAKLCKKGRITIFQGGQKAMSEAMYDKDNAVYILIIRKNIKKKDFSLKQWFDNLK